MAREEVEPAGAQLLARLDARLDRIEQALAARETDGAAGRSA